jgi:hypothetical protein
MSTGHQSVRARASTRASRRRTISVCRSKLSPSRCAHPGAGQQFIAEHGGTGIVDLVAQDHPRHAGLRVGGRQCPPVRHRRFLHPAQVDDVVDVPELVDVRSRGDERQFVNGAIRRR